MWRDLEELGVAGAAALALLPLVALILALLGSRVAQVVLALCAALVVLWAMYYALDLPNPGVAGAALVLAAIASAWVVLIVEIVRRVRHTDIDASIVDRDPVTTDPP
jgi:hypothetical protein